MAKKFLWKIGGEAGFGIMTTGLLFSKIAARLGYHIFDYFEYPSLIRGGHNTTETLVSDDAVHCNKKAIDILVCLNEETYLSHQHRLTKNSIVIYDRTDFEIKDSSCNIINIPFKEFLKTESVNMVMINNIALGASLALMGWDLTTLNKMLEETFEKKGVEVIQTNKRLAEMGFNHIQTQHKKLINSNFPARKEEAKLVLTGNDAFSLAAIVADCRLYCAYPMTPASSILSTLASYAEKTGMIVRHAEDEISVVNTALGASWAGVRSAVGTSGGGFALMVESISFAGVAEAPIVIFLGQRPGPATGLPTWTEQGDLLFAVHAGHGEFPKIVLSPGDTEEMYEMTATAFDLADIYQTPVIIISDKMLCESHKSTSKMKFDLWAKGYEPNRGKIFAELKTQNSKLKSSYLRYELIDDGISPMLIPGKKGIYYQSNSYEHAEDGHTTESATDRVNQVDKRDRKEKTYLKNHFQPPKVYGNLDEAKTVFVSWGSTKGAILEAMPTLAKSALINFTYLYPLDEMVIKPLFVKDKHYVLIENNSHGQFGKLLRQQTGIEIKDKLLKYDGRPIWPEEIRDYIAKLT